MDKNLFKGDKDRCKSEGRLVQLMANLANEGAIGDLGKAKGAHPTTY